MVVGPLDIREPRVCSCIMWPDAARRDYERSHSPGDIRSGQLNVELPVFIVKIGRAHV